MSDSVSDFYQQKTDAELLFFVEHPEHYQPLLVDSARRELGRRGVALPLSPAFAHAHATAPEAAPANPWGKVLTLGAILLVLSGGTYWLKQRSDAATATTQAKETARRRLPPPRLVEVPTSAIPNFDGAVARAVAQQLSQVPALEKADAQHLRQFRGLARRFWAAETQAEYLTNQATAGQAGP